MTSTEVQPGEGKPTAAVWRARIIGGAVLLAVLVVVYFILSAFIPRWWAQRVGSMVHGSFAKGIGWGLFFGGICTLVTLFLLLFAVLVWRRKAGKFLAGAAGVVAVLFALPNLMTLTIVLGNSSAAPAFRGAALTGAVGAALLLLLAVALLLLRRWRRTHPRRPKAEETPTSGM
jgi:hypothetical protein